MALHHILVVHDSPAVRETVGILLAGEYEVQGMEVDQYLSLRVLEPCPRLLIAAPLISGRPLPEGAAVLWVDDGSGRLPGGAVLGRQFSPRELRRQVAAALARSVDPVPPRATRLEPPFVPADAARTLAEAVRSPLPLHLAGEPGVGKRAIARAVHTAQGRGQLLMLEAGDIDTGLADLPGDTATVFVTRIETLAPTAQQRLLGSLGPTGGLHAADGSAVRLITATTGDLGDALDAGRFSPELYYRLTLLRAELPPLRERPADIPDLARRLAADLALALGRPPVALTERALERLANYLWFGNVSELEAVLARTLALGRHPSIDAEDLSFDGARLPRPRGADAGSGAGRPPFGAQQLDLIINELAHEFKNPLVTLKTFAHHLRSSLAGSADGEQAARLTGEAVEQIDQTLENLLEFTRLAEPAPQTRSLPQLLDPILEECRYALAPRGVRIDHDALPAVSVRVDPQQLSYALGNLVRALGRDLARGSALHIGFVAPATLTVRLPDGADPLGNHLAVLIGNAADTAATPPLGVAIATAVLDRNGAQLAVASGDPATVLVRLQATDAATNLKAAMGTSNGSTPSSHR
ncbi:MAG TPA: sigma 54-interacting transcriptional regulator [Candidatus Dormibacteraeota bacterium]|nr:sigma 54-interacting transcriptional regulator [Candidatus Dormibacteraeota bacterium]